MIRRAKWCVFLPVILIAVAGCSCASDSGQHVKATPTLIPTPIVPSKPTYVVQRGEVTDSVEFSARVAPVVEQELYFRTSGYVEAVYVKRNDEVEEGDLLAELEVTDLKNQLRQAEAALTTAESDSERQIAEAEAQLRTAELNLAIAKANDPAPQVVIADVGRERAQMALEDAQKAYDEAWDPARDWELNVRWRKEALEAEREATERRLHEAQLSLEVAEAQYQQALQAQQVYSYNVQIREQEVALAEMRLQQLESGLHVEELRLNVERLKAQLNDAQLIAPFDGQVLAVSVTEGRAVDAYKAALVVADIGEMELSADLSEQEMSELQEGMPATCSLILQPGEEFSGHVRRLPYPFGGGGRIGSDVAADEDQSTRITLEKPIQELGLEMGDRVRVTVVLERKDDVLWLPPQAIRTFEGRKFVVVQDGDLQRRVDVKVGIEGVERVEVEGLSEELTEGQIVVGQ